MSRISSMFFLLSLIVYYVPKIFKIKKFNFIKVHIILGSISVGAMCIALIQKIGQVDFLKYIGFTAIMLLIGWTGYIAIKKKKKYKKIHLASAISFFVYLALIIIL